MTTMLPLTRTGSASPALVLLHFFAGSQREWTEIVLQLAAHHECITIDLPGFGEAASVGGYSVREMMSQLSHTLRSLHLSQLVLVGHSMSGKVALSLAASDIGSLAGLVLVAPSPPSPEPIEEKTRQKMLSFHRNSTDAQTYLDSITAHPLTGDVRERAIQDFIGCAPSAWSAWLERGSREDWSKEIGMIDCPSLIITGEKDPSLSAAVQEKLTLPHLTHGRLEVIPDCGHLPMMEAPEKLAPLLSKFLQQVGAEGVITPPEGETRG